MCRVDTIRGYIYNMLKIDDDYFLPGKPVYGGENFNIMCGAVIMLSL